MRLSRIPGLSVNVLAIALLPLLSPAHAQVPTAPVQASAVEAAPIFRDLLSRFYEAYARKDLAAIEALWHPGGPARYARNILELEFELKSATLLAVSVTSASIDPGGGRARAIIDLDLVDAKTKRVRRERRVREVTFLQDHGVWKIWNDGGGATGMEIAQRLIGAPAAEQAALIKADPEVRSDDVLRALGLHVNRLRTKGDLRGVLDALRVRIALARALGDDSTLAASLLDVGLVHQVLGQQQEAGRVFAEARDLFAKVGTRSEVAVVDGNLGSVDYVQGDYPRAAERFRAALEVFDAEKDQPRVASLLHSLGNALYMQGDFEPAMACYQRSLSIHETADNKYSASSVLQAIALVHKEVGNYSAAIEAYARSAALSGALGDQIGEARAEHGLGDTLRLQGDFARALQHFGVSLGLWEKTLDAPNRATTMYATGQVYALQRSFARAIDWYQRALDLDVKSGEQAAVARDLGGLGGAHFGQGQLEKALEEYAKSLAIREQLKDAPGTMWTVVHMGVLQSALGRHSEALQAYERALSMAEAGGDAGAVCTVLALRAANELAREDVEAALATSGKAIEIAERLSLFDVLANARLTSGKAQRKAARATEAAAALQEAVAALERVPIGPGVETFFDDRRGPYLALVDLLVEQNRPTEAFHWAERARTRALAAMLGGDGTIVVKGLTAGERDEERKLTRDGRTLAVRLRRERARAKPDADRIGAVEKDLERAKTDLAAFRRALFEAHPGLAVLRAQAEPLGLDAAAPVLSPSEAVVSFAVGEARTHVFVVRRNATAVSTPGSGEGATVSAATVEVKAIDLVSQVTAFREAVARREPQATKAARELYRLLIAPIREALAGSRSIVVLPDAFLWSLAFEALQNDAGRYLIQDFPVSYAPSLTALGSLRNGDTVVHRARPSLVAAAEPSMAVQAVDRLALARGGAAPAAVPSARELRSLALLFGPARSRLFSKDLARADRVVAAVEAGAALHLAVPGCLLDASPLFSVLAMAPAGKDDTDQGLVELADTMGWTLPADLVMLPHVEHGQAGTSGEALVALTWALHIAGSPTVVLNRSTIPGTNGGVTTAVTAFYRNWIRSVAGKSTRPGAAEALQRAARSLIGQAGTQPADWAGLMVIGR